ncbi:MAG: response regulator [Opitutae bacterium]|nr:response regulator [Opitutae bacterium]
MDDDPAVRKVIAMALTAHGYTWEHAENGRRGREMLHHRRYRMLITDIFMPDGDGLELLNYCRAAHLDVPVIAISGGGTLALFDDVLPVARMLGCCDALGKPLSVPMLLAFTRRLLGGGTGAARK